MEPLSKAKLREFAALGRKAGRQAAGLYLAEGQKLCAEAFALGVPAYALVATERLLAANPGWHTWPKALYVATETDVARLSTQQQPEGVVAVLPVPAIPDPVPIVGPAFVLDGLADPGNLGTLLRTAAWYGFQAIYAGPGTVEATNPKAVRGSMGACFRVPVYPVTDLEGFVRRHCNRLLATYVNGPPGAPNLNGRDWILLGSESHGLPPAWQHMPGIAAVCIAPGPGGAGESLNVAVTGAILADRLVTGRWLV